MFRHRLFRRCGQAGLFALLLVVAPAAARADIRFLLMTPSGPDLLVLDERMETIYSAGSGIGLQTFVQAIPGVTWESLDPRPGGHWVKFQARNTGRKFWVTSTGKMCPGANAGQWMVQYGSFPQVPDPDKSFLDNFVVDGFTCVDIPFGTVGCVVIIPDGDGLSINVSGVRWNACSDFGATLFASAIGQVLAAVGQSLAGFELPPGSLVTLELGDAVLNAERNELITLLKPIAVKELTAHGAALLEAGKGELCARGDLRGAICDLDALKDALATNKFAVVFNQSGGVISVSNSQYHMAPRCVGVVITSSGLKMAQIPTLSCSNQWWDRAGPALNGIIYDVLQVAGAPLN